MMPSGLLPWSRLPDAARNPVLIVFLADVFNKLVTGIAERRLKRHRERARERPRIVESDLLNEMTEIDACPSFHRVELLGVRRPLPVEPRLVVESNRIDDERV